MTRPDPNLIGTSDYPAFVAGASKYKSPHDVWLRMVRGVKEKFAWPDALRLGQLNERSTARLYLERFEDVPEDHSDRMLDKVEERRQPPGRPWQRYHAADFYCGLDNGGLLIECKNRSRWVVDNWGEDGTDEVGLDVYAQVQGQLEAIHHDRDTWTQTHIPDLEEVTVAVAVDGFRLRYFRIKRDREAGEMLVDAAVRFYTDHVLTKKPPALDGTEGADRYLQAEFEPRTQRVRGPTASELEVIRDYRELRDQLAVLEDRKDLLEQKLKAAIGDDLGLEGSDFRIRWNPTRGRVKSTEILKELYRRVGLSAAKRTMLENQHRGESTRRFEAKFY